MNAVVLGEALIDFIAGDDGAYRPHLGGSPYNVAIGLARQGIDVGYLSPFSDDSFGDRLREALQREGVHLPLARRSLLPTSLALVAIDDEGLPNYRLYRQGVADKDTTVEEIEACLPDSLELFHTGSLAITPSQLPKIRRVFELVKARGGAISIDINIRLRASVDTGAYLAGVRSLLPAADIVKASDEDLGALGIHEDPRESAKQVHAEMGSGLLVLTEGRGGARLHGPQGVIEQRAYPVADLKDTVGAGDTFHAALLAALSRGGLFGRPRPAASAELLGNALDFACAAAAINVSRVGCSPPTEAEVRRFLHATGRPAAGDD